MDDKILWDIIDGLRDEIHIKSDGITDLNHHIVDLNDELKALREQVDDLMIDKDKLKNAIKVNEDAHFRELF